MPPRIATASRCILDVVYNHFGPEGNYLHLYAPQFFNERTATPWGAAINFDGPHSRTVRDFFIHNALYWLAGVPLRRPASGRDPRRARREPRRTSSPSWRRAARAAAGDERTIYLTLENFDNAAHFARHRRARPRAVMRNGTMTCITACTCS